MKRMTHNKTASEAYNLVEEHEVEHEDDASPSLGRPAKKKHFEGSHVFATGLSLVCLIAAYIAVTPQLRLAWLLRFDGQIVAVGFLLGVMNLCTSTVVPHALLLLEARFGRSSLRNYEALLQSQLWSPGASPMWRLILSLLVALPLGLSVAYKRFLGGNSSASITMPFSEVGYWKPHPAHLHGADLSISTALTSLALARGLLLVMRTTISQRP